MITILASIGFILAVTTFIGGFRMIRRTEQEAETVMHRVNGYITLAIFIAIASLSVAKYFSAYYFFFWLLGFGMHIFKIIIARKGLAIRYGGYMGALLLITWLIIIFTHLPS